MAPGVKVRMSTKALPHAGLGVPQYIWSTSPLRRYTDLVNQWQIIACARHGSTAALAAPFKSKDADLFSIISAFEAAYTGYNGFQRTIERYWTLLYLQQQGITELEATVMRDGMVRASHLPLVFLAVGAQNQPRGTVVLVKITTVDLLTLDVSAQLEKVIQTIGVAGQDTPQQTDEESADEDDDAITGPIELAVDIQAGEEGQATL
jgi:exoribonuclease-2